MFDNRENVETLEQQDIVFAAASSSFRNANVTSFQARKAEREAVGQLRNPLVERTNTYPGAARSASVSPECKKVKTVSSAMDELAQQSANQSFHRRKLLLSSSTGDSAGGTIMAPGEFPTLQESSSRGELSLREPQKQPLTEGAKPVANTNPISLGVNGTWPTKLHRGAQVPSQCYLVTVEEEEDRDWILAATPLFLGPHMVFALPWEATFNPADLAKCKVPVWVDLPNIHPSLEAFGTDLLRNIGVVLYTTCEETDCKFTNIRGCLRLDLSEELPESIEIVDPIFTGEGYFHPIQYCSMPDACFHCHQRGHVVRQCQSRRSKKPQQEQKAETRTEVEEVHNQKDAAATRAEDDFTPSTGKKPQEKTPAKVQSENPYEVLAVEEVQEVLQDVGKEKTAVEVSGPVVTPTEAQLTSPSSAEMEVDKETKRKREAQSKESKEAAAAGDEKVTVTSPDPGTSQVQGASQPGSQTKAIRKSKRGSNAGMQKGGPNDTTVS
ncbi:hypothetical protein R1sor_006534 [Riccia sorocarpa]|uniref:CCHC-type domain-containing protein n=1 Tax=Riccia sorocarpa TaxID=122646 RepID=A0ABD3HMQ7_9MARC